LAWTRSEESWFRSNRAMVGSLTPCPGGSSWLANLLNLTRNHLRLLCGSPAISGSTRLSNSRSPCGSFVQPAGDRRQAIALDRAGVRQVIRLLPPVPVESVSDQARGSTPFADRLRGRFATIPGRRTTDVAVRPNVTSTSSSVDVVLDLGVGSLVGIPNIHTHAR